MFNERIVEGERDNSVEYGIAGIFVGGGRFLWMLIPRGKNFVVKPSLVTV